MAKPDNLKTRSEFLRVQNRGCKSVATAFVLQGCFQTMSAATDANHLHHDSAAQNVSAGENPWRIGYTASKRVGNAVCRNRAKRRLRAVVNNDMAKWARPNIDYVLIARANLAEASYRLSGQDLQQALAVLHRKLDKQKLNRKTAGSASSKPVKDAQAKG